MSESLRVLVVDDEADIRDLIAVALRSHGFDAVAVGTGEEALHEARLRPPDLVLLDVLLPGMDGFEVCRRLWADGDRVPVIFLTARDIPSNTVTGLTLGGDGHVTKPVSTEALLARVRAVLPRAAPPADDGVLRVSDLELDATRRTVRRAGADLDLSPTEFRLLACLMRNSGRVLSRPQILESVWGNGEGNPQVVETYISYLRRKLDPLGEPLIHTRRGVGYTLHP
ncbi:response regulator transcription factor [Spirillospora sp. NBC_01491]|uniref:response regulator transcription factor n=1 Tax=Spirillospora sp. NBC_01491 TaxID=2976007 RepID=UPI002E2FA7BD|nr:response regulator transcription factor [Spirillospora sp. NBC_01491]